MVDDAIGRLKKNMNYELFKDREGLVDLTHQLPLWKETFMYKSNKEMSIAPQDLQREFQKYIELRNIH